MKRIRNLIVTFLVVAFFATTFVSTAFAAETPSVSVPVEITLSGTLPVPAESYKVCLKADKAAYPMPAGTENGVYSLLITGADSAKFPMITYDALGVYSYTVYQAAGSNGKCTYDDTIYTLTVYVTNAENGDGFEATATLYPNTESGKLPGVTFENIYEIEPDPTPEPTPEPPADTPKTGDESNLALYVTLAGISAVALAVLFFTRRRKMEK